MSSVDGARRLADGGDVPGARELKLVVLGDSVCVNFARASAGFERTWSAADLSSPSYPELVAEALSSKAEPVRFIESARIRQTIKVSQRSLASIVALRPAVVIVAHGGHESLLLSPRMISRRQSIERPSPSSHSGVSALIDRSLHRLRFAIRVRASVAMHASTRPTARLLSWVGFRPVVPAADYEARLRDVVGRLVRETDGVIVLMAIFRTNVGSQHIFDPREADANDAAASRLAAENPGRVLYVPRPAAFDDPVNYLADGTHLSRAGHAVAALSVIASLETSTARVSGAVSDRD